MLDVTDGLGWVLKSDTCPTLSIAASCVREKFIDIVIIIVIVIVIRSFLYVHQQLPCKTEYPVQWNV